MQIEIKVNILKETTKCGKNITCLKGENKCLCTVEDTFDKKILFIKPFNTDECDYKLSFGHSYVCRCPTRKELYLRYKA